MICSAQWAKYFIRKSKNGLPETIQNAVKSTFFDRFWWNFYCNTLRPSTWHAQSSNIAEPYLWRTQVSMCVRSEFSRFFLSHEFLHLAVCQRQKNEYTESPRAQNVCGAVLNKIPFHLTQLVQGISDENTSFSWYWKKLSILITRFWGFFVCFSYKMAKRFFLKLFFGGILAGSYVTDTSKVRWAKKIRMGARNYAKMLPTRHFFITLLPVIQRSIIHRINYST